MLKRLARISALICLTLCFLTTTATHAHDGAKAQRVRREVAVTFDDLPATNLVSTTAVREMTRKLLSRIKAHNVPVVGFVNEGKLWRDGKQDEVLVSTLEMWLDAGFELGNHTYSHPNLHTMTLVDYEADVVRGETLIRDRLRQKGMRLRYFRHPHLYTGQTLETKQSLDKFLSERGYEIAPVTVDNADYIFAFVYADAKRRGDRATMKRLADAYIPYMEQMFEFFEKLSVDVAGYEIKQTLLVHANELNADTFDQLVRMMRRRGYAFITLERALQDKAYRLPDNYAGRRGVSWLHRWAITKGMGNLIETEPEEPKWVRELFNARQRRAASHRNRSTTVRQNRSVAAAR
ncbi:MAG TPA: polysaccharide deacetylase family protein [Pyrinomonadaceae bacterium]|jgi:peptidoglycan/xylan/chitin deacetylase (PgdA/CDA1 family)